MDKNKIKAIEMLLEGDKTQREIADALGISRQTLYRWRTEDEEFKEHYNLRLNVQEKMVTDKFSEKLEVVSDTIFDIITDESIDSNTRLSASRYWLDRALGTPSNKLELSNNIKMDGNIDKEDILTAFDNIKEE